MAQETTIDEELGHAEQLPLDLSDAAMLRHQLDLIPASEFAAALGLAEQTLAAWRSENQGPPFVKVGKTVFYRRVLLNTWLNRLSVEAMSRAS